MYYPSNSSNPKKIVLPQDLFRSSFTWFCYEIYKSLAFRIWMLLWLPLSVWWKLSNNCIYPLIVSLLVLFLGPIFVLVICGLSRKRSLSKQLIQFCKEVTETHQVLILMIGKLLQQI
ncbi:BPG_G0031800.mRNA.1.CDS.1 [Saccharomyces cerevisiae]|nr:BPG_G0031800.mRNA.1.CDS.1 [Saccharomyces cerevisiae]CAI7198836.1 BPG_G0031800.mRNA.1.CDS.1 [Saccharomyces cerevisiae]